MELEPGLIAFIIGIVCMVLYSLSRALTWQRSGGLERLLAYAPQRRSAPHVAPQRQRMRVVRRQGQAAPNLARSRRRDALIRAGLALGMTPAELADVWQYSPRSTRRRITVVQARPAVAAPGLAQAVV